MVPNEAGGKRIGVGLPRHQQPDANPFPEDGFDLASGTDGPLPCPFCGWKDPNCGHLVVAADRTFMEFLGRHFDQFVAPAEDLLEQAVGPVLRRVGRLPAERRSHLLEAVQPPRLRALLRETLDAWPELPDDDDEPLLVDEPRWDYLEEILLSSGDTVGLPWDFEGDPGQSSAMVDFWSSDPAGAVREARRLILSDVAALDRLLE